MKYRILQMIKDASPSYVSGELLSKRINVSRTAVWKHINELRTEGYNIESSSKKGYRLVLLPDKLNEFEIGYNLGTRVVGNKILYFDTIDSTNNYAKKIASEGCTDGTVVAADTQTAGKGRLGRKWESNDGKGIYLTIILKPSISPEDIQVITIAASTAIAEAIESVTGMKAGIKWPNDVLLFDKKVCGILTEMNCEADRVNYLVCGAGINFSQEEEDFPPELRGNAISLSLASRRNKANGGFTRLDLVRAVLQKMDAVYSMILKGQTEYLIDKNKKYSITLGKKVLLIYRDMKLTGTAVDILNNGRLVVECDDGITREVMSGEVSIR